MTKDRPHSLLNRLAAHLRTAADQDRRENPDRFISAADGLGPNHLFVENVARMLGCNVDHVRRIPRGQLPAAKVGQRLIYARADVTAFIAAQRDAGTSRYAPANSRKFLNPVAKLPADGSAPDSAGFDALAYVRRGRDGSK